MRPPEFIYVLIVDDEAGMRDMLVHCLGNAGIHAVAAESVRTAIDKLDATAFDLVISDVGMPDQSGADLFEYVLEHHAGLPFVFMTGCPDLDLALDTLRRGCCDYIVKPFEIHELTAKVQDIVAKSRRQAAEKDELARLKDELNTRLKESQIFKDVIDATDDGLLILDPSAEIVSGNPGFERLSGCTPSAYLNRDVTVLEAGILGDMDTRDALHRAALDGPVSQEIHGRGDHSTVIISHVTVLPIRNDRGELFAHALLLRDITKKRQLERQVINELTNTNRAQEALIFGLARLTEERDQCTGFHLERIRNYCRVLARDLSAHQRYGAAVDEEYIDLIYRTAPLHDIGKVGIPDNILLKRGRLTEAEFEIMKQHPEIGQRTLDDIRRLYGDTDFLDMGGDITYCHHECFDGSGYPRGLAGDAIPLSAQILTVADVYDALTSERPYKAAFDHNKTIEIMTRECGTRFAPDLFHVFMAIADKFDAIRTEFADALLAGSRGRPAN